MLRDFSYVKATSVNEAVKLLSGGGARVHAGGTDLLGCLRDHVFEAQTVVSISRLKELRGISAATDGGMRIGALTTIAEIAAHDGLTKQYSALPQAAAVVASPQLRNQGTIGGNLCQRPRCWYFRGDYHCARKGGDTCYAMNGDNRYHCIFGGSTCLIVHPSDTATALVALGASAQIAGPGGSRTVALEDFFVLPEQQLEKENVLETGEIVSDIMLPPPNPQMKSSYRKVRARNSWDFALAGVGLALTFKADRVEQARIVLSAAAPKPWRVPAAEKLLIGKKLDAKLVGQVVTAVVTGAEPLTHNGYKVPLFRGVVEESLTAMM